MGRHSKGSRAQGAQGDEPLNQPLRIQLTKTDHDRPDAAREGNETISGAAHRLILKGLGPLKKNLRNVRAGRKGSLA